MYKTKETALKHLEDGENFKNRTFDLMRKDKEVALTAVEKSYHNAEHLPKSMLNDKEFVKELVNHPKRAGCMMYLERSMKDDSKIGVIAIQNNGFCLQYCNQDIRSSKEHVLTAVKSYGDAIAWASKEIKNDREVVEAAVRNNTYSVQWANESFRADADIARLAIGLNQFSKQFFEPKTLAFIEMQDKLAHKQDSKQQLRKGMKL